MFPSVPVSTSAPPRSASLQERALLDGEPEALFQSLAEVAAALCETPIALVCLADDDRLWFKARVGVTSTGTARDATFCDHVLRHDDPLQVSDATADPRFADSPLVTGPLKIRSYAGVSLRWSDGVVIGTLCVLDRTPRTLAASQMQALEKLAGSVVHALETCERAMTALTEIEEARSRFAQLYRATPIPLFSLDRAGRLLTVSDAFVEETGYTRDELMGSVVFDLLTPGSRQQAFSVSWLYLEQGRTGRGEYQVVRKDGTIIDIQASYITERDENGCYVRTMGVFENITARRQAELELREESVRSARIIEATNAGTWELDCRTHQTRSNERYAGIIGHTLAELGDTTLNTWAGRVHPHDLARVEAAIEDHMGGHSLNYSVEYRLLHKNGTWVWIHDHACVVERNAVGWPVALHGVCTDITARKETEEALRASQAVLERVGQIAGVGGWDFDLKDAGRHVVRADLPHPRPTDRLQAHAR